MNLDDAIQAHGEWKVKLRMAINKKEQLDATTISADNQCPLGKWLHGEAKQKYSKLTSFLPCVTEHAKFHKCAGNVARTVNAGKYPEADNMLSSGTEFMQASSAVAAAIHALKREAKL